MPHNCKHHQKKTETKSCYCRPGDKFCGKCEVCKQPGHTRHYPGPVPYTGAWCDQHYQEEAQRCQRNLKS